MIDCNWIHDPGLEGPRNSGCDKKDKEKELHHVSSNERAIKNMGGDATRVGRKMDFLA